MTSAAARTTPFLQDRRSNDRDDHAQLADIIFHCSFGRGEITLASGRKSNFYFDMKPSMLDPQGASLIAREILEEVTRVQGEYVGGLEMGAVPIAGAVCQHSFEIEKPVRGFFVRKQPKQHGAKKLVEGLPPGQTLQNKRIVVVDDVTTTGESAMLAVNACIAEGAKVALVISIVDRQEGAAEVFKARNIPFRSLFTASDFLARG
jgi:orotate phosphoribosyltransferase